MKIGVCGGTRYFGKGGSATISSPGTYRYSDCRASIIVNVIISDALFLSLEHQASKGERKGELSNISLRFFLWEWFILERYRNKIKKLWPI